MSGPLPPLEQSEQAVIESVNYLVALAGIGFVFLWHRRRVKADRRAHAGWLGEGGVA